MKISTIAISFHGWFELRYSFVSTVPTQDLMTSTDHKAIHTVCAEKSSLLFFLFGQKKFGGGFICSCQHKFSLFMSAQKMCTIQSVVRKSRHENCVRFQLTQIIHFFFPPKNETLPPCNDSMSLLINSDVLWFNFCDTQYTKYVPF